MENNERAKRVQRLKKIIIVTILSMVVIPTGLAIFFGIRLHIYKNSLLQTREELNYYLELQSEADYREKNELPQTPKEVKEPALSDNVGTEAADSAKEAETTPKLTYSDLTAEEIEALELTDEEIYDGYRKVYLTFDDGPSSNTDDILDILKEYGVKATFFVIKKEGKSNEKLYQRIVDEGHSIGMHSTSHKYAQVYESEEAFLEDTYSLRNFLYLVTGVESDIYRFPGGSSNKVSKIGMKTFAQALNNEGIIYFDWNVSAKDSSTPRPTADEIVYNVTSEIKKYNEVIILMHDTQSRKTTVSALPRIIEYIQSLDDTVILPITRGTKPVQHLTVK